MRTKRPYPRIPAKGDNDEEFSFEEYEKLLEILLKAAQDEYRQIAYDLPGQQRTVLRNYQWLSTVILAAQCAMFASVVHHGQGFWLFPWSVYPSPFFYICASAATLCCVSVFILGLDTLRGRGFFPFPYQPTYKDLIILAHKEAHRVEPTGSLLGTMIKNLDDAISLHREAAKPTGPKLRAMSWGLLLSLLFTAFALLPNMEIITNQVEKEVIPMGNRPVPPLPTEAAKPLSYFLRESKGGNAGKHMLAGKDHAAEGLKLSDRKEDRFIAFGEHDDSFTEK